MHNNMMFALCQCFCSSDPLLLLCGGPAARLEERESASPESPPGFLAIALRQGTSPPLSQTLLGECREAWPPCRGLGCPQMLLFSSLAAVGGEQKGEKGFFGDTPIPGKGQEPLATPLGEKVSGREGLTGAIASRCAQDDNFVCKGTTRLAQSSVVAGLAPARLSSP